jgi:hypothetical protein
MDANSFTDGVGGTADEDDDADDVDDGQSKMTKEEISMLEKSVKPVQLVLFKVGLLSATSLVMLNNFCSFKKPHMQSRTQQHLFYLSGSESLTRWQPLAKPKVKNLWEYVSCLAMLPLAGTTLTRCLILPTFTVRPTTKLLQIKI